MTTDVHSDLVQDLLRLQRERATGVLRVDAERLGTNIFFLAGRAVYADSAALGDTLGRLLMETGLLNQEQYAHGLAELKQALVTNRSARMGGVLVDLGYVTVEEVQEALIGQMARRIAHLMQFPEPRWSFTEGEALLRKVPRYPMRVEPLILEGIRLYWDRARMTQVLSPYHGGFIMLRANAKLIARCFSLARDQRDIVVSINGTLTTEAWLVRQTSEHAWPLTTALALTGVLAVAPAPPSGAAIQRESERNPSLAPPGSTGVFEVALVEPPRRSLPPNPAPVAVVIEPDPQRSPPPRPPPPRRDPQEPHEPPPPSSAAWVEIELPPDEPSEQPPAPEQLERLEAESACRLGIDLLHAERFAEAEQHFHMAVRAMPDAVEYELYWRWAESRVAGGLDKASVALLDQLSTRLACQDSRHAFPPYVAAHVALSKGDHDTAYRFFKVAQHRDLHNKDAAAQMRLLARRVKR